MFLKLERRIGRSSEKEGESALPQNYIEAIAQEIAAAVDDNDDGDRHDFDFGAFVQDVTWEPPASGSANGYL